MVWPKAPCSPLLPDLPFIEAPPLLPIEPIIPPPFADLPKLDAIKII
jgi:hypothetical protein